jgi:polyribonucleotide nucleotidyltransferase
MQKEAKQYTATVGGRTITFETGKYAGQAGGSVTVRLGDSIIFAAATMSSQPREGLDFFPLTVDYEERMYAGGRIPGSFFRREGRPGADAILTARLTDRPIRPLFPYGMRNGVQIIMNSFSADGENPLDILAINAASCALAISDIPWEGPVGAVRVGHIDGEFIANPTYAQMEESDLDLLVAGSADAILMVEAGAKEVPEDVMVKALAFGQKALQPSVEAQRQMAADLGKEKREVTLIGLEEALKAKMKTRAEAVVNDLLDAPHNKAELYKAVDDLRDSIVAEFVEADPESETAGKDAKKAFEEVYKQVVRDRILYKHIRPDGRDVDKVRPIFCEVGAIPRAHGSGLFTRGETQVLNFTTLGTPRDAQELDNLTPVNKKRYIHHYNFPPYSVGEVKPLRGTSRRDIGHGNLAERALVPVIPAVEEFPYTMRLVSEVLASNGSSSMASVCGSTLSLMDAGVPISAPVTGIAMGLIKEGDKYVILTDIQGLEDHLGDMDFKVAGTQKGITALQMDIKIKGITPELMAEALEQARAGRDHILSKMMEEISKPNPELKDHAPRITVIQVPVSKIGAVIGPGGKNIRSIQEETGAKIDIQEDGSVFIAATDGIAESAARERILACTETAEIGRIYTGKVVRTTDFGAFVEILPGTDGLVHISQLDTQRVNSVEDIAQVGDELTVMVTDIDHSGKIRLSRQAVLEGWTAEEARAKDKPRKRPSGGNRGGNRSGSNRSGGGKRY